MKLATFGSPEQLRVGVVVGELVHPMEPGLSMLALVQRGLPAALVAGQRAVDTAEGVPLAQVRLAPPLHPPSIRDFLTFEQHLEGALRTVLPEATIPPAWFAAPTFYFTNPHSLIGAFDEVAVPPGCALLDFELEVAAVVGRDGRDLGPAQASEHLFGYAIFNDWSARDLQSREMQVGLGPCKGKDFASTLGPWIVTADELAGHLSSDGRLELTMTVSVNGTLFGQDQLSQMAWSFPELLAYASRGAWVRAGDVLGSGTCANGCLAESWGRSGRREPAPLQPGDVVSMTVQGLGTISNLVVAGSPVLALPPARPRR